MFEFLHGFLNKTQAKQPNFCIPLETSLNDGKRNYIDLLKLEIAAWIFICTYSDVEIDFRYAIHHRLNHRKRQRAMSTLRTLWACLQLNPSSKFGIAEG